MSTPDLKPCPFCGGKAFFTRLTYNEVEDCVACTDCNCVFTLDYLNPEKEDLAEAWNRRANDD